MFILASMICDSICLIATDVFLSRGIVSRVPTRKRFCRPVVASVKNQFSGVF